MKQFPFIVFCLFALIGTVRGQEPASYARQVRPFLAKYCIECHNPKTYKRGLDLETYKTILEGSDNGKVLTAGKPDESLLVLVVEGKKEPHMPPKKAKRYPTPAEVVVLRSWIKAGAKDDSAGLKVAIPDIKPRVTRAAPVTALAYRPDGSFLARGQFKNVDLLRPETGRTKEQAKFSQPVTALAYLPHEAKNVSPNTNHFAVACGQSGMPSSILLFPTSKQETRGLLIDPAHKDVILDMAFSPNGKALATASYDTTIKLWNASTGKELRTLKEHSDSVYGVSFSKDGTLLASAAADRAVKIWNVTSGKLLYTFGEPTDWVYAVAWSPDGKHLAAAGADRSIRIWETGAEKGRLVHSVFAHEGAITKLAYSPDGKTLYSVGEDRIVKAWDAGRMVEKKVFARQPETILSLAVSPDGKHIALGRYDGQVLILDESGKVQFQIGGEQKPAPKRSPSPSAGEGKRKPSPPEVTNISPTVGQRGKSIRVVFQGKNLDEIQAIAIHHAGAKAAQLSAAKDGTDLEAEVVFPANTPAGMYQITLENKAGKSAPISFTVDLFPLIQEQEPNDSPGSGQRLKLPASVSGTIARAGDVDYFRFDVAKGQQLGVQILTSSVGSKLDPYMQLISDRGTIVAESGDGILGYTFPQAGTYALGVRDRELRGGANMHYRLHLGETPVITSVFPLGLQKGTEADIHLEGVHLGGVNKVHVKATSDVGSRMPINLSTPLGTPLGARNIVVGEFPEVFPKTSEVSKTSEVCGRVPVPGTANGILKNPGQADIWSFQAEKGRKLILEVNARRLGSPLDSVIEILDTKNQPVQRATLRSLAKTFVTFRDHDSAGAGIRIDAWDELAVNDYIYVGSELLRIQELPPNPDADCVFFSDRGQRVGFLDTTPTHHALGTPMYKVEIHPPGKKFSPNGYPVISLAYRNDDGGPGYGRDSRLFFDPPGDGEFRVRISDSRGRGGSGYAYRLTVRLPRPNFNVSFNPTSPTVSRGGAVSITATAERLDGYQGEIALRLENVPDGFSAPATTIPAGENSTVFAFFADRAAKDPGKAKAMTLVARASIGGKDVVKNVDGGLPKVIDPGDIVTTTAESEVTVKPGSQTTLMVHIERRNGFKGRVPVEVRGLPHGVRVLDIGLNGILINEKESKRAIVIYAEPWVQPTTHPFVVLARREGKNSEHAAKSVLLRVAGAKKGP
ncbi:MAG TPA: c-type cytochrome domain-containing protein [Gemmataceae bacterium]|nr:c-type cytochrome domain-containing protein [Gemmataceae bacterium]